MKTFFLRKLKKATSGTLVFALLFSVLSPWASIVPLVQAVYTPVWSFNALQTVANVTAVAATGATVGADGSAVTAATTGTGSNGINIVITDDNSTNCIGATLWGSSPNYTITCDLNADISLGVPLTATVLTALIDGAPDLTAVVKGTGGNVVTAHTITLAGGVDAVAQRVTFTPVSPTIGETFSGSINGTSYTYTVTGSMTVAQVVTAFTPLISADPAVNCTDDTTAVTCTAVTPGTAFTYAAEVVDITPPATPIITLLDPINSTNKTAVTIVGTTESGTTLAYAVLDSGTGSVTGTGVASSTGVISITGINITALVDGTLTASIVATDSVGNASATGSDTATKDTVMPTATVTSTGAVTLANSGAYAIVGTGSESLSNLDISFSGSAVASAIVSTGGTSFTGVVNLSSFADGIITYSVTPVDMAGNTGSTVIGAVSKQTIINGFISTASGSFVYLTGSLSLSGLDIWSLYGIYSGSTLVSSGILTATNSTGSIELNPAYFSDFGERMLTLSGENVGYGLSNANLDAKTYFIWPVNYEALYNSIGTTISASGIANNFTGVTNATVTNFSNLYFEKPQYGKILFSTGLDLTSSGTATFLQNLPNYLDMTDGHINFSASGSLFQSYGATLFMYFTGASVPEFSGNSLNYITARDEAGNIFTDALSGSTLLCAVGVGIPYQVCTFANNHFTSFDFNPYLTSVHIQSNNASGALAKAGNIVSISFSGSEALSGVTVTIAGQPATVTGASTSWAATYTMTGGEAQWVLPFTIHFSDVNNNSGTTATGATDGSSVTFDSVTPTAAASYSTTGATSPPVTVTLTGASEPITVTNNSGSLTKMFAANGSFTFEFADAAGNTGATVATVANIATVAPSAVNLGSAGNFAILSKTAITDVPSSVITGNVGASPISGTAIGVTCAEVTGTIYSVDADGPLPCRATNAPLLTTAVSDMETAYTDAAGRTSPTATELGAGDIGGLTIAPGLYKWSTSVTIPTDVTLSGGVNDVWIFQIDGNLSLSSAKHILLGGGAQASNIFWQVSGLATLNTTSVFNGTILSLTQINMLNGATLNGRALAQTQVTLDHNTVSNADTVAPTATVVYSTTGATNGSVTATLTGASESITVTNNSGSLTKVFAANGSFTFEFVDGAGNTGSTVATVSNIDTTAPTATVVYSTTGATNGSVTATLTGASESITVTNNSGSLTKVFAANGSFTFAFSDAAGNTGSAIATVSNIDTTVPALSSISVTPDFSGTGASYTFDVNETATGTIYVGTGTSVLSTLVVSGSTAKTGSATHTGVLAGLTAGADYYYYIQATDAAGNITNSATGTFSSADTVAPNVFNKRVDGVTSTNGTVKFDFTDTNYTVGTGPKTGTGYTTIGTGVSLNNIGTGYLTVVTGSVNTASSAFASLVADTVYNYAVFVTDNFGNPSSASTGSFVTASAPIDLTVSSTNTGTTTLTGATVASGSGLALSGVITVVSDSNDSNSVTGSLVLSGVTNITVSGSTWNGTLLPPTLVQSGSTENASTGEISTIIPQTSFVTVGNTTTTTTYTSVILQTVKVGGESGVSLIASGSNFRVSFAVPSSSSGTVLKLYRSIDGSVWEVNSPDASCTLDANKLCTFDTNHLSFFAPTLVTPHTSSVTASSGGGGGVLSIDACPSGDTSGSYYDGKCSNGLTSTGTVPTVGSGATVNLTKTKDQVTVTTTTASGTTTTVFSIPPVILKSLADIRFTDISDNWAKNYIIHLVARGVVDNAENYRPDNNLTRAEFLKITMNAAGWQVPAAGTTSFADVPAHMWYTPYIALALSKGIVTVQNANFRPNDSISRAEAAKIIVAIFGANVGSTTTSFADVDVASDLAKFIETAKTLGFFSGQNIDGKLVFRPNDSITRAEIAKVIVNAFGL